MKRAASVAVILIMILSMLLLGSCGSSKKADLTDSKYVGTWKATTMSLMDASEQLGQELILTLNGDGTGTLTDAESESGFTWELTNDGFRTKGDVKLTFKDDGEKIKTKIIGVDMFFEKQ